MSVKLKKFGSDANNQIFVRMDTDALEKIEKELGKAFVAQVGVLGQKAAGRQIIEIEQKGSRTIKRKKGASDLSNADIGLIHEKGSPQRNIPRRSFLEVPLTTKMPGVMDKMGAILLKGINEFNIEIAYKKLAAIGEGIVLQAFPTRGYGTWPNKSDGEPSQLIKTAQLSQSISSRVITK